MKARDGRIIASENEVRVLRSLWRFGWLRNRDLAALAWQNWRRGASGEPTLKAAVAKASGLRMAQRTLRRLTAARQVLRARAPDGSVIYALAEAGARRLQSLGIAATTGKDMLRAFSTSHFRHRVTANEIAIGAIVAGYRVSTEREIAQDKWFGGIDGVAGKKPDVLLRGDDGRVWWCEVERSRKNSSDYAKLLKWLGVAAADAASTSKLLGSGMRWGKIIFICTPAFRVKLTRDLTEVGWKKSSLESLICFSSELYRFEDIVFS